MDYKELNTQLDLSFMDGLHPDSKVWVYHAGRIFSATELESLDKHIAAFCNDWASHGSNLKAVGKVLLDRILVLVVDESNSMVSGCSIDSSVAFVKNIGSHYKVDMFDRMIITYFDQGEPMTTKLSQLSEAIKGREHEIHIFDNLVKSKKDLISAGLVPIEQSWVKRFI